MSNLLICGSRHWRDSQPVIAYINRAVQRAVDCKHTIIVGDALGVDEWVCAAARDLEYQSKTFCYGIASQPEPRNGGCGYYFNTGWGRRGEFPLLDYRDRDAYMVDLADIVVCIWNGYSKGTLHAYGYADYCGKEVHRIEFNESKVR